MFSFTRSVLLCVVVVVVCFVYVAFYFILSCVFVGVLRSSPLRHLVFAANDAGAYELQQWLPVSV